ncbi:MULTISPECIES: pentapeptide repeat-containing protein [unclassified Curtobacterium]
MPADRREGRPGVPTRLSGARLSGARLSGARLSGARRVGRWCGP